MSASANFAQGHANAMLVGPRGLEQRSDVWVGISLLAPMVRYPNHKHPPNECYLLLSPGQFRQGDAPWFEPGAGGMLFNQQVEGAPDAGIGRDAAGGVAAAAHGADDEFVEAHRPAGYRGELRQHLFHHAATLGDGAARAAALLDDQGLDGAARGGDRFAQRAPVETFAPE